MAQMEQKLPTYGFKTVLLGDSSVGKSSLVHRFCFKNFVPTLDSTVGAAYATQPCYLPEAVISFEIWDTAGAERYATLVPMYYRGAPSAVVVYDITNEKSYQKAQEWLSEVRNHCAADCKILLIGNKVDLNEQRKISTGEAQAFAQESGILFRECSAMDGTGVDEAF